MKTFADQTAPVRAEEKLDLSKLQKFLHDSLPNLEAPIKLEQFPGGHSNLTYLVRAGDQEFVLRRPPYGSKVKSAHDMGREFKILSKLHHHFGPAPKPAVFCEDESIIGAPFYLMERINGIVFRTQKPEGIPLSPHKVRDICYSFIETLAKLHTLDYRAVGLENLYKGPGYLQRQVEGWQRRWAGSKTDDIPEMELASQWLARNLPDDSGASIIHNDFKFDNLLFDTEDMTKLVGVLDWEMSTIGDPLSDLAVSLSSWREARDPRSTSVSACFLCSETGALTREELIRFYSRCTGFVTSDLLYHYVLALYKGAVIIQQIFYRWKTGLTKDPRFGQLINVTRDMAQRAVLAVHSEKI